MTAAASGVAYLAPELPALSATFVYEELLGVEQCGIRVFPVTVRAPTVAAAGQSALALRTRVLYSRAAVLDVMAALPLAVSFGAGSRRAFGLLIADMRSVGPLSAMSFKLAYQWLAGARLAHWLRKESCSHLHVHFAHTPAQIAMYASAFSGVPFTITAHANDIFERGLLLRQKAQRAAKLLTISHYNLAHLLSVGVPGDRLAVIRCGVTFEGRADVPSFEWRPRYRLGTLCRLVEKKGVDDLLRAVALLRATSFEIELSIAGDGPLRGTLETLVEELGLRDCVHFAGAIGHDAVSAWLRSLDVFVVACKKDSNGDMDGIPVVLMEAMSQRVPVISTRLSGIPELVIHELTGLLATPADPQSLAMQLRRLLEDPEMRARLSGAAVLHVASEFGQELNLNRLLGYFKLSPENALPHRTCAPP